MDRILGGQIGLDDIIYVHRKGIRKQVEVTKTEKFLGLTIADNSNGCSYIKKVKLDSTASRVPFIKVSLTTTKLNMFHLKSDGKCENERIERGTWNEHNYNNKKTFIKGWMSMHG